MKPVLPTVLTGLAILLPGCSGGESFRTVQTCVSNERGVADLKTLMRSTAQAEQLEFIDNSTQAASALQQTAQSDADRRDAVGAIDVHIEGNGGLGATAGNLGLPRYQVALAFTEGSNAAKAHRLAERLIKELSHHFKVEEVPLGKGVVPVKDCGG